MASTAKVLLVDRDRELVDLLAFVLGRAGLRVSSASDQAIAMALLTAERPDVVILGFDPLVAGDVKLLQTVRRRSDVQVILLGAHGTEDAVVRAFELGADDYLAKPISFRELLARIHVRLRRVRGHQASGPAAHAPVLRVGDLVLDPANHTASHAGRPLPLTPTEFRVLQHMLANAGVVVPAHVLLHAVWGRDRMPGADVVRVTVHRLRRKLHAAGAHDVLGTLPGTGFILRTGHSEQA